MEFEKDLKNAMIEFGKLDQELQEKFDEESNLFFAFGLSKEEVIKSLKKQGCNVEEIVGIGHGAYIHKKDIPAYKELIKYIFESKKDFLIQNVMHLCGGYLSLLWDYEARISFDGDGYDRALNSILATADLQVKDLSKEQLVNMVKTEQYYNREFDKIN